MVHIASKEPAEHEHHDRKIAKGREYAPGHAQDRALVPMLKVAIHELLEQEGPLLHVLSKSRYGSRDFGCHISAAFRTEVNPSIAKHTLQTLTQGVCFPCATPANAAK